MLALSAGCASCAGPAHQVTPTPRGAGQVAAAQVVRASAAVVYVLRTTRSGPAATVTRLFRSDNGFALDLGGALLRTTNGGATWIAVRL